MDFLSWCRLQWDRVAAVALLVLGVGFLINGWIGASDEVYVAAQVPFVIAGGLGGIGLLIVGATLWISADLSDEWRTLDRLDQQQAREAGQ